MQDFRSEKSESREGKSVARRAWDGYARGVNAALLPLMEPALRRFSMAKVVDLVGFWVVWHLHGGFEGLLDLGMSERTIYRRIAWFRMAYGAHPDEYRFPGLNLRPDEYFGTRPERGRRR